MTRLASGSHGFIHHPHFNLVWPTHHLEWLHGTHGAVFLCWILKYPSNDNVERLQLSFAFEAPPKVNKIFSNITIDSFNYWLWRTLTAFLLLYPSLRLALTMHPFAMDPVVLTRSIFSTDSGSVPTQVFASSSNLQLLRAGRQNARSSLERTHYFDEDLTQSKISGVIHQSRANARLLNLKWRYALHSDIYTCTPFDIS